MWDCFFFAHASKERFVLVRRLKESCEVCKRSMREDRFHKLPGAVCLNTTQSGSPAVAGAGSVQLGKCTQHPDPENNRGQDVVSQGDACGKRKARSCESREGLQNCGQSQEKVSALRTSHVRSKHSENLG